MWRLRNSVKSNRAVVTRNMEFIQTTRALSFKPNTLSFVREQVNVNSPTRINEAIDLLIQWIQKQNHFIKKDFSREYLERCVIISKGSVERAKRKMEKSYTFRTLMPELLQFSNPRDLMKEYEGLVIQFILPQLTDRHDRVYVIKNSGQKFTSFTNYYKFLLMMCEYIQAKDYNNGVIAVFDYLDTNVLEVVKTINLLELRQLITIVTEGFSLRLKGVHFMTSSKAIDTLVSLLKQALSEKLAKRIHVHRDLTSLKEHFPLEILPIEYGGKEKSMYKLQDDLIDELESLDFMVHLREMQTARTDESKRQTDKYNEAIIGMPGSFRTLSVD